MGSAQAAAFLCARGGRLVAGTDISPQARDRFSRQFSGVCTYQEVGDILGNPKIDAVVVATPTLYHKRITVEALRAGKHVLCEKPMARTTADGRRMLEAARRTRKILMVAHCRRFDRFWGRFAQIVDHGSLGRPLLWRCVISGHGPGGWFMDGRLGGGPLFDAAVHNYDFANLIFGKPVRVIANSIKLVPKATAIDTANAIVEYRRGDQLMVSWSWAQGRTHVADVLGPRGSLIFGPGRLAPPVADKGEYSYFCRVDGAGKEKLVRFAYDPMAMYVSQARHFIECIRGRAPRCLSSGHEAIKAVSVAEAVLKTAIRGGMRTIGI